MEFCQGMHCFVSLSRRLNFCFIGGGIIDMMNRRLRERLTEAEILQIFVDVCEGVALMHNFRPPLLHRDLKVENILQSSSTTFKLCDFGSATPAAQRPPANTQEIKALESDLNRHTTLQYRAPEMIDPYLRRPVDEKSDVWALGVLLYKLCYYTTPFEEQGPLAILNVRYAVPPYPVYSQQLQCLIGMVTLPVFFILGDLYFSIVASMLREHGTQRPTVFSLLEQVHRMRGTKSRFTYQTPSPQPLSPRVQVPPNSSDSVSNRPRPSNSIPQAHSGQPKDVTPGAQAREKVLEAIAPLRRGRPLGQQKESAVSRPPSPPTVSSAPPKRDLLEDGEDKPWRTLKGSVQGNGDVKQQKSGAGWSAWKPRNVVPVPGGSSDEPSMTRTTEVSPPTPSATFGDSFAEKLWNAYDGTKPSPGPSGPKSKVMTPSKLAPPPEGSRNTKLVVTRGRDAFDGLGLPTSASQPPTLGEARKLRTGLAAVGEYNRGAIAASPSLAVANSSNFQRTSPRPSPSRAGLSWKSSPSTQPPSLPAGKLPDLTPSYDLSIECSFPSLEELDATFAPSVHTAHTSSRMDRSSEKEKAVGLSEPPSSQPLRSQRQTPSSLVQHSVLHEQTSSKAVGNAKGDQSQRFKSHNVDDATSPLPSHLSRPIVPQSSSSGKRPVSPLAQPSQTQPAKLVDIVSPSAPSLMTQRAHEPKDWLTGDIGGQLSPVKAGSSTDVELSEAPVLREFTKKRSSFIEANTIHIPPPQEVITGRQSPPRARTPVSPTKSSVPRHNRNQSTGTGVPEGAKEAINLPHTSALSYSRPLDRYQGVMTGTKRLSGGKMGKHSLPEPTRDGITSSSGEESPEDAIGMMTSRLAERDPARKRRGRQSSVHDLVDLWGGGVVQTKERPKDEPQDSPVRGVFNDGGTNPHKSRAIVIPSATKGRASSPQRFLARPADITGTAEAVRFPSGRCSPSPTLHTKQVSTPNIPTSTASARPQSVIAFPVSKSVSDGKSDIPTTPSGLSVPQDGSRRDGSQRTSITNMVQRYEAMNATAKAAGYGPSSLPKPSGSKIVPQVTSSTNGTRPVQPSLIRPGSSRLADHPSPTKDIEKRPTLTNSLDLPSVPTGMPNTTSSRMVLSSNTGRSGQVDGLLSLPPVHKATAPSEDQRRSPSPEKPYQGVGKLINQWQKKSEEAMRSPVPRRGYVAKRASLVSGNVQE